MTSGPGVLLVGVGAVGVAHARALLALGVTPVVVGRGAASAAVFQAATGLPVLLGGVEQFTSGPSSSSLPERAVVAVPVADLAAVTTTLLRAGVRELLVEKPVGLDAGEVADVAREAAAAGAHVYAAYNRRFHVATIEARRLIAADGGVRSVTFDFTERSHLIAQLDAPPAVKQEWLLANSSHVVDLAFHLAGAPVQWHAWSTGSLSWHSRGAAFAGAGRTSTGALFRYGADWGAPGGWGVEVTTSARRLSLRPLERLATADRVNPELQPVELDYGPDIDFKPGFLGQLRSFLGDREHLLSIEAHVQQVHTVLDVVRDGHAR